MQESQLNHDVQSTYPMNDDAWLREENKEEYRNPSSGSIESMKRQRGVHN